jgi:preprotein translocase subunit YajC
MGQILTVWLPFVVMLVIFYLLIFIPENRRKQKYKALIDNLKVNDDIVTKGGIIGKITNVQDDFVIIQTGPDKARIKVVKNGISDVMAKETEESKN